VLLALLVQAATYVSAALVWRQALGRAGHPRPLRTLIPLGIAKLFTDQVLPTGGISGTMLAVRGLIRRDVPPEAAMAAMLAGLASYDVASLLIVLASAECRQIERRSELERGTCRREVEKASSSKRDDCRNRTSVNSLPTVTLFSRSNTREFYSDRR